MLGELLGATSHLDSGLFVALKEAAALEERLSEVFGNVYCGQDVAHLFRARARMGVAAPTAGKRDLGGLFCAGVSTGDTEPGGLLFGGIGAGNSPIDPPVRCAPP